MPACPLRSIGAYAMYGVAFRKYTLELCDRPSAPLELEIRMLRVGVLETMLYGCVTCSPRACPLRHAARGPPQVLDYYSCIGLRKNNCADHQISYLDTLMKTGSESIEATSHRRRMDVVCGICCAHGGYEPAEVGDVWRVGGGCGLCGGPEKRVDGMIPGRPQSFRHQRRPVDDCSPGRGGMAKDGGTRGGTCRGEMDRCRESQGWTTACSSMSVRDGKGQGEGSPKQAGSCWFARHS